MTRFILAFLLGSGLSVAQAKVASFGEIQGWQRQSAQVVQAFNVLYPDLNVAIVRDGSEDVLLEELAVLRAVIHGQQVGLGQLIHLACCNPKCGSDCKK